MSLLTPAQRRQATLVLIDSQLDLYDSANRIRLVVDWSPGGGIAAPCTPLPDNDNPMEAPT